MSQRSFADSEVLRTVRVGSGGEGGAGGLGGGDVCGVLYRDRFVDPDRWRCASFSWAHGFGAANRCKLTDNLQTMAQAQQAAVNADGQREAIEHAHDPWWDSAQPDGMKAVFFGKEYLVGPGGWTSIDVTTPASSGRFKYVVELEGLDRFRARPNGEVEREFVYPNRENLQPYQMSGWCRTLLVQPLDDAVHRVRVKYVRMARDRGGVGY
jgi:hypothetical protein